MGNLKSKSEQIIRPGDPADAVAPVARGAARGAGRADSAAIESAFREFLLDFRIARAEAAGDQSQAGMLKFFKAVRAAQIADGARRFDAAGALAALRAGLAGGAGRRNIEEINARRRADREESRKIILLVDDDLAAACGEQYVRLSKSRRAQLIENKMKNLGFRRVPSARTIRKLLE